jgi:hypothetical protein
MAHWGEIEQKQTHYYYDTLPNAKASNVLTKYTVMQRHRH